MSEDYLISLITRLCNSLEKAQWPGGDPEDIELIKEARLAVGQILEDPDIQRCI